MTIDAVPKRFDSLRAVQQADEPFLFDVFCTAWEQEVAAMPDARLVRHFLRIQYTAQETRFRRRFPGHERYVITHKGEDAGRAYLHRTPSRLHAVDMILLPRFRSLGIGSRLVRELFEQARDHGQQVGIRVPRRNERAARLYAGLGFRLVAMDDLDRYYEWDPETHAG
ncbi:MAG TPA: GNAT family N-acetyltransferase [Nocardioides sp.]|uniref:GNAT family N-acetyltransferase n=1 Tax=Nocardioides sp. TaxID=35761 RepID=UPI002D806640|nr:GNAT family N-acetyltransferase [Nocardioides sp.]HET6651628.1 GNAT family N-acetyltransferase [Nocardioides sp.]